jgi:hypothetical protein
MSQPQPKPAFYATPHGVISPTYLSSRKHGNSQRRGTPSITMPQESVAIRPSTTPQGPIPSHSSSTPHRLIPSCSSSTPPAPIGNLNSLPFTAYEPLPSNHSSSAQTSQLTTAQTCPLLFLLILLFLTVLYLLYIIVEIKIYSDYVTKNVRVQNPMFGFALTPNPNLH